MYSSAWQSKKMSLEGQSCLQNVEDKKKIRNDFHCDHFTGNEFKGKLIFCAVEVELVMSN